MIDLILKKPKSLKNDLLSGITVALALVPEAIAFSFVAYVDPTVGLYAAFMMGLITAIFGGRPGMISGATGAVAVIFAPLVIQQTALHGAAVALHYLFLAVIVMGIIQLIFGLLKWGKFIRLVPHPVMLGFVNGLAIIIFKAQFSQFYTGSGDARHLLELVPLLVMVGLIGVTMLICHFLPKLTKVVPATLVAILTVTGVSFLLKSFGFEIHTVLDFIRTMDPTKTTIAASLPSFQLPMLSFEALKIVFPYAFLAAFVGLIESLMTLVLIDELTDTKGSGNQESMAQGFANLVNGFFGGMGGCAMIGQSMINIRAGGRSRVSGIAAALSLLVCFLFGAPFIEAIPLAALVGVMFMVSIATFEWSSFRIMKDIPKSDAFIIVLVSAITVIVDLAVAVFLGVIVATLVFAWEQGKIIRYEKSKHKDGNDSYVLHGNIFFGSAQTFKELFDISQDSALVYIDFKDAKVVDHSAIEAVQNITARYKEQDKEVLLVNLSASCSRMLGV
ncbi:MAG: sodium-independent anion transporter [Rickettsiales bacterium]|nr:sodium-independent anion transporter [Rickettsiales bacterium]